MAEQIYGSMTGKEGAAEGGKERKADLGFAHGEAGLLYFLYAAGEAASMRKFQDCVMERMPRYVRKVQEIVRKRYFERLRPDLSWCKGLAGIGTMLIYLAGWEDEDHILEQTAFELSRVVTELMWSQSGCRCHGNAGSLEFLMDINDLVGPDETYEEWEDALVKYLYTQRFYDGEGNVRFTDESKLNSYYDYGTGAAGTMRALLRAKGIVHGQLFSRYSSHGMETKDE